MFLLRAPIFKNSHFLAEVYFIFLKTTRPNQRLKLDQTSKTFNTKLGPQ